MTTNLRCAATLSAAAMAALLTVPAFGQTRDPYYDSRQAYMEEAGRRWDAIHRYEQRRAAEIERSNRYGYGYGYGYDYPYASAYPYASDWRAPPYYSPEPRWPYLGAPVGRESNPNDYATGIYNPKK